jgi:hypothetical protein
MKKPLPKLKPRQVEILILLHRFRYLSRPQIQAMLGHKTWAKVITWLNDLTDQHFIYRFYEAKLAGKPAVYCLDKASIRYLRQENPPLKITEAQLKRIYKDKTLSDTFREHCLFLADMYLSLQNDCERFDSTLTFVSKTELQYINYLPLPRPDAYYAIKRPDGKTERYFLDVFDPLPPRMMLRRRIWQYCNYYGEDYWQDKHPNASFPDIVFILPEDRSKRYVARQIKKIVEKEWLEGKLAFFVGTWKEAREKGIDWEVLTEVKVE